MPLWTIHHPAGGYSVADKAALSEAIVPLYPILPRFYVGVVFHELPLGALYIGGQATDRFVRIAVDHIARQFKDDALRQRWLARACQVLEPFTQGRGYDWELHIDETPFALWRIQGQQPPLPDSEHEKYWIRENRPLPYPPASPPSGAAAL